MKKRILSLMLSIMLAVNLLPITADAATTYWSTAGNFDSAWYNNNPNLKQYTLDTPMELAGFADLVRQGVDFKGITITLGADMNLSAHSWIPIGLYLGTADSTPFKGTFDGNGHTISGLTAQGNYFALFSYIADGAKIQNLTITEASVTGNNYTAGLVAYADAMQSSIEINNCQVNVTIEDKTTDNINSEDFYDCKYAGGIVAYLNAEQGSAKISNCKNLGTIEFDSFGGGIIGEAKGNASNKILVENCQNNAVIDGGRNSTYGGGIAGVARNVQFVKCSNFASVYGEAYSDDHGSTWNAGIAGGGGGLSFEKCANYGGISAWVVGGLTCATDRTKVVDCLNVGGLSHSSSGGRGYILCYDGDHENSYVYTTKTNVSAVEGRILVSLEQLASGEVCYLLNGSSSEGESLWGQNLDNGKDVQKYPYLGSAKVYKIDDTYSNYVDGVDPTEFEIRISENMEGGNVVANVNTAKKKAVIILTVTPDQCYELDELTVQTETGDVIEVTDNTFVMPYENVIVTASFKLAHSMAKKEAKEATCTEDGNIAYWYCSTCEKTFSNEEGTETVDEISLEASGHDYKWKVSKKATASKSGYKYGTCKVCGTESGKTKIYKIEDQKLSFTKVVYNGEQQIPEVIIEDSEENILVEGVDYKVTPTEKGVNVGRFKMYVKYMGDYSGEKSLYFTIVPVAPENVSADLSTASSSSGYDDVKITWDKSKGATGYRVYYKRASAEKWTYAASTTKQYYTKKNLSDGKEYDFKVIPYYKTKSSSTKYYDASQYNTASVYTLKKAYPPQVDLYLYGDVTVWVMGGPPGTTGYQISQSSSKNKTNIVKTINMGESPIRMSAPKGKTRYYKTRAYKVVNGKKVYAPWSDVTAYKRKK